MTRGLPFVLAALLLTGGARAASLEVAPTAVELPSQGGPAQMRLVNHGNAPVTVQIEAFAWTQDGADTLTDSDAIVLSPPLAELKPVSTQIVRLLVTPGPPAPERAFRVVVTQLPDPHDTQQGTRVLLQFVVPLFAGGGNLKNSPLAWSLHRADTGVQLEVRNGGTAHAKFTSLTLVDGAGTRRAVSPQSLVYVLAGGRRSFTVTGLAPGALRLEGVDEIAHARLSLPLTAAD